MAKQSVSPKLEVVAVKTPRLRLIDTTFRDAQQSLLGGHLRGDEIVPIAAKMDAIGFTAMEAFGGATFERNTYAGFKSRTDEFVGLRWLAIVAPNTHQALIRVKTFWPIATFRMTWWSCS
jgi:pyruvate/oxaloacetate carboxyltransferase